MDDDIKCSGGYQYGTMPKGPRIGPKRPIRAYLALWRESKGLTQEQLADRLDTSKSNVSRWENDKRVPNNDTMAAIAEALNIPIGALYRLPDQKTLDDMIHGAPPEVRNQMMDLAEILMRRHSNK